MEIEPFYLCTGTKQHFSKCLATGDTESGIPKGLSQFKERLINWEGHSPRDRMLKKVHKFMGVLLDKLCLNT